MTQQASYSNLRQHQDLSPHQLIYDFRLYKYLRRSSDDFKYKVRQAWTELGQAQLIFGLVTINYIFHLSPHQLIYDFRLTIMRNNFWIEMKDKKDVIYLKALFFFTVSVEFSAPFNLLRKSS